MSTWNNVPFSYFPGAARLLGPVNSATTSAGQDASGYSWSGKGSMECDTTMVNKKSAGGLGGGLGAVLSTDNFFYQLGGNQGGSPPDRAPGIPRTATAPTTTTITVYFPAFAIGGFPPATISVLYGTTQAPTTVWPAVRVSPQLALYTATVPNLTPGTTYYFKSVASNPYGAKISDVSPPFTTASGPPPPSGPLKTNLVVPFLIQGPRFGTPATTAVDYYINVDAVGAQYLVGGTTAVGQQVFAAMYAGTAGTPGDVTNGAAIPVPYAGACTADQVFAWLGGSGPGAGIPNYSDTYLQNAKTVMGASGRLLVSWGGFYGDILGLFGPYQPPDYPAGFVNPSSTDVVKSFLYNYCGRTTQGPNPLGWERQNTNNTSSYATTFDGLVLDFENVGRSSPINGFPQVTGGVPQFPLQANDPQYAPYKQALCSIVTTYYELAPTLFLGNAPVSLSIVGDCGGLGTPTDLPNICAPNSALNTWFAFPTATQIPTSASFNTAPSLALNHPEQMSYFDDVFVQFYNESADYYLGGQYFIPLLACWGYTVLQAQAKGRKSTKINIGLCKGSILPGGPAPFVANAQGAPAPLGSPPNQTANPPFEYWYPQYCEPDPPNYTPGWPDTGIEQDPAAITGALNAVTVLLQSITGNTNLVVSDWCSGAGFWAGPRATAECQRIYTAADPNSPGPLLPALETYCWSDAQYPSPDPQWVAPNIPIVNRLT